MEWIVWKPFSDRVRIPTWVDSVEKSSPPPKKMDYDDYLLLDFILLPSTVHGVSHWWMSPDTTRFHQVTPCCSCEMPWDAAARGTIFCVCGQVVKLFPVSISFLTLVVAAFAKFKKFRTVFLKDVWFSTMFQHLKIEALKNLAHTLRFSTFVFFPWHSGSTVMYVGWFLVLPAWCTGRTFSKGEQGVWDSGLLTFQQPLWLVGKQFGIRILVDI